MRGCQVGLEKLATKKGACSVLNGTIHALSEQIEERGEVKGRGLSSTATGQRHEEENVSSAVWLVEYHIIRFR